MVGKGQYQKQASCWYMSAAMPGRAVRQLNSARDRSNEGPQRNSQDLFGWGKREPPKAPKGAAKASPQRPRQPAAPTLTSKVLCCHLVTDGWDCRPNPKTAKPETGKGNDWGFQSPLGSILLWGISVP